MEQIVKVLITFSTIVGILLVIVVIAAIIHWLRTRAKIEKLFESDNRGGDFVYNLLQTTYSKGRLIRHAVLPEFMSDGTARRAPCDLILVERGGVFVIREWNSGSAAAVDNPSDGAWRLAGPSGIVTIPNLFEQNKRGIHAVKEILRRENVYNVPIYNIVVFSGDRIRFRYRSEKLTTAEALLDTLRDFNRNKFLSQNEISDAVTAIKKYMRKSGSRTTK